MSETLTVPARFNGPADSANGGYIGGALAKALGGTAAVSLRMPPPLDTPLELAREGGGLNATLSDGTVVAIAEPATVDIDVPPCPSYEDVLAAEPRYAGFAFHAIPTCFVCGTGRAEGDGLRIFASPIDGTPVVAAIWTPGNDLATNGMVDEEFIWAALDCPGYFAVIHTLGSKGEKILTGRMAVEHLLPVRAGEPHVVIGWGIKSEGRKHWAGTAIYTPEGQVAAKAEALWIKPRRA